MRHATRLALLLPALLPAVASAHTGDHAPLAGFIAGLLHPLAGPDHLAAMLSVGVWSALALRRTWLAPAAFVALLAVGALAAHAGIQVFALEPMIAASVLALGLLVAWQRSLPVVGAAALAGGFAFFHGAAHGYEVAAVGSIAGLGGLLMASAALHVAGMGLGRWIAGKGVWLRAGSGGAVAMLGVLLLARAA